MPQLTVIEFILGMTLSEERQNKGANGPNTAPDAWWRGTAWRSNQINFRAVVIHIRLKNTDLGSQKLTRKY